MGWIILAISAVGVFFALTFFWRVGRSNWEMLGAALLLGVAGYAWQGHPGMAGSPREAVDDVAGVDQDLLKQRQSMGDRFGESQAMLTLSDAYMRQGKYGSAAAMLGKAVRDNPQDADLWVALGNALVGHSNNMITPAAQLSFQRAADISPQHPGPPFFMGLSLAQSGRLEEARILWQQLLERSPEDAPWRADLVQRLERIDQMIGSSATIEARSEGEVPSDSSQATPTPESPQLPE